MSEDFEILKKYYDVIRKNIDQLVSADIFAANCIKDYREKEERGRKGKEKKRCTELRRLGKKSRIEIGKKTSAGRMESLNALVAMIDILRD
ncbi:hypothetical protein [Labilibaculum euxinus]